MPAGTQSLILLAAVACELMLMAIIHGIARFYELKFKERTHEASFLMPVLVFIVLLAFSLATGLELEWEALATNACTLVVLMTAGLCLYRKMMGVAR